MIAAWMLYSLVVGMLVGLAAHAAERFCRMLRLPLREVWIGGLLATSLLSTVALFRIATTDPIRPVVSAQAIPSEAAAAAPVGMAGRAAEVLEQVRDALAVAADRTYAAVAVVAERTAGGGRLLLAWGILSGALLLALAVTLSRLRRARNGWQQHRIGGIPVLVAENFGPAVVGLVRPAIVTPAWLLAEPQEWQQLVVQHEDEHRRAGDPLVLAVACIAVCLLPWNLAMWWLLRRTRLALELDCDARVLRRGATPWSYGSLLLEIAGRAPLRPFSAPALADSRIHLERRLLAMTENSRTPARARAAGAGLAALLIGLVACNTDGPTAADIESMDVAAARAQAEQAGVLEQSADGKAPLYVVDGAVVTDATVKALAPNDIASIQVFKGDAAITAFGERGANGVVHLITRASAAAQVAGEVAARQRVAAEARVKVRSTEVPTAARSDENVRIRRTEPEGTRSASEPAADVVGETKLRSARPLLVVDGTIAPEGFELGSLSPESIEAVEVLKAEAATNRYGARGANGVILITTKAGRRE